MSERKVYEFDRFIDGVKMAEGARITRSDSEEEALESAKKLFYDSPKSTFILREART